MYISIPGSPIVRTFDIQTFLIILQFLCSAQYRNRVMGESYLFSCVILKQNLFSRTMREPCVPMYVCWKYYYDQQRDPCNLFEYWVLKRNETFCGCNKKD